MSFTLAQAAEWLSLPYPISAEENLIIQGVSIDTRTLQKGDLFVALKGNTVDGHACISEAVAKGAVAVLVEKAVDTTLPVLQVDNTQLALGKLSAAYRAQFTLPVIGLTGSVGKTTVKELLVHLLGQTQSVLYSIGNQNNEIGVPLTLLRLSNQHQVAVIEMGARQVGDIAYLAQLAKPTLGLITNIGVAHIEIFGSVEKIAQGKTELFAALPDNGTLVVSMDDIYLAPFAARRVREQTCIQVRFDSPGTADFSAKNVRCFPNATTFNLVTPQGDYPVHLNLPGRHNVGNALLAAAAAYAVGLSAEIIQQGLNRFEPPTNGRLTVKKAKEGAVVIDDTYNANPVSVQAALAVLSQYPGKQILVMGDMLELGDTAVEQHQLIGTQARSLGVHALLGLGPLSEHAVAAFGENGQHFETVDALSERLQGLLKHYQKEAVILVKGSRGMKMEKVVAAIC